MCVVGWRKVTRRGYHCDHFDAGELTLCLFYLLQRTFPDFSLPGFITLVFSPGSGFITPPSRNLPGRRGRVALPRRREKMSRLSSTGGEAEVSPHANLSLEAGKRWLERREELNDRHAAHRTSHVTHTRKRARITCIRSCTGHVRRPRNEATCSCIARWPPPQPVWAVVPQALPCSGDTSRRRCLQWHVPSS